VAGWQRVAGVAEDGHHGDPERRARRVATERDPLRVEALLE
jgi:hypothetical protein